ncbi:hypothetical protein Barb6XT_01689 [Bacteroidales bacterium Barb6XT]|nr:hypothetical protein Barb6XT_01689 [Bacteroidales bacterium Barb6XT]
MGSLYYYLMFRSHPFGTRDFSPICSVVECRVEGDTVRKVLVCLSPLLKLRKYPISLQ